MEYQVGMKLKYFPADKPGTSEDVEVVGLRKHGSAKLSNGWLVNADGVCEGNASKKGGHIGAPGCNPKKRAINRGLHE